MLSLSGPLPSALSPLRLRRRPGDRRLPDANSTHPGNIAATAKGNILVSHLIGVAFVVPRAHGLPSTLKYSPEV